MFALALRVWWVPHFIVADYGDQTSLETFAANVAHGQYYGTHGAYWPPAFIFLAGFVERAFGTAHHFLAVREADALVSALAAASASDCARRLFRSNEGGLGAGLLLCLYSPAIYYANTFLGTSLDTLALATVCDAVLAYRDQPAVWRLAVTGVAVGMATLTKPTLLPLIVPAFVVWGLRGHRGFETRFAGVGAAIALAIVLVVTIPWTVRNLRVTGSPVFIDVNGGVNLLIAHNPEATGRWVDLGYSNPILLRGSGYDQPNTGRYALEAAFAYFAARPAQDVVQWRKIMTWFWTQPDTDISRYGAGLRPLVQTLHVPLVSFPLLRDLAVLGMILMAARGRPGRSLRPARPAGLQRGHRAALLGTPLPRARQPASCRGGSGCHCTVGYGLGPGARSLCDSAASTPAAKGRTNMRWHSGSGTPRERQGRPPTLVALSRRFPGGLRGRASRGNTRVLGRVFWGGAAAHLARELNTCLAR